MGLKRIVAVSGVSQGQLWKLMYGKPRIDGTREASRRIRPETEASILAVRLDLADGARIPSLGAVRRVQALVALGWSQAKIAARLGVLPSNLTDLVHGRRTEIRFATDRAVRALYNEWSMRLPPTDEWRDKIAATRSRKYGQAYGWLPPLAWDDGALDNPTSRPTAHSNVDEHEYLDQAAIYRRIQGDRVKLTKAEKAEVVRRMSADGWSLNQIERQTGIKPNRYTGQSHLTTGNSTEVA